MQLIVTRPAAQAAQWVAALQQRGLSAVALPLLRIADPDDVAALRPVWQTLARQRLVVFVSPNAAERFFAHRPDGLGWPASVAAASPGPGTSRSLRALGVPEGQIVEPAADAAQFDSESLWDALRERDWAGAPVLVVRGDGGREWLAERLRERGAGLSFVSAYRRLPPLWTPDERQLLQAALAQPEAYLWCFSSAEAVTHLCTHLRDAQPGASWAHSQALATHPRIAERARAAGFGVVHACRPPLSAVAACIQSISP